MIETNVSKSLYKCLSKRKNQKKIPTDYSDGIKYIFLDQIHRIITSPDSNNGNDDDVDD